LYEGHDRHACALLYLVVPLAHEATAMRVTDTAATPSGRSGAVPVQGDLFGDVDSTAGTSPTPTTRGSRASTGATRTTTTSRITSGLVSSADEGADGRHAGFSFEELVAAYFDCRRTKRNSDSARTFESDLERNLYELHLEISAGAWRPGRSICFVITRPRPREVWAAPFRDRIVHHLLYNRVGPRIESTFIADSCACIPGRGTLYAAERLESKVRSVTRNWSRHAYYLKCDVANFFVAIDKRILRAQLERRISGSITRALAEQILLHDPRIDVDVRATRELLARIPPHKSLFNQPAHRGLPIGNLSSQFFANVYLDALDQRAKHELHARHYIRYVDDFLLLHESAQWLNEALADVTAFLPRELGIELNTSKTILQPVERGVDFVGQVSKPWRRALRRRTFRAAVHRCGTQPAAELFETANSYFGLLRQATHSHGDRAALANILRARQHCVSGALTKTYRRSQQHGS
jgi:RNA-directed DNA polymerase